MNNVSDEKKRMRIYLLLVLGVCYLLGASALFAGDAAYELLHVGFTAFPVLAAFLTRRITKERSPLSLSLKVWKNPKLWAFCALVPGVLIALGAALYFAVFPGEYSGVLDIGSLVGTELTVKVSHPLAFGLVCVLLSALSFPIQLLELGEEIGWREYLLPKQIARYGLKKAVLLNGFYWGLAHMPLIYLGFNYSPENAGAPWSNMAMMLLACVTIGTICSYVMVKSNNVMYSAIIHGVVNVIGEIPVFLSVSQKSGLLGPNPTGLLGMAGLIVCALILFLRLGGSEKKGGA